MIRPALTGLTTVLLSIGLSQPHAYAQLASGLTAASLTPTAPGPQDQNPPNQPPPTKTPPESPAPQKKPKSRPHLYIGPDLGVYLPTNARTRSHFGDAWFDFGVGIGSITSPRLGGTLEPDFHLMSQSNNGNDFFAGLLGIGYRRPLLFGHYKRPAGPGGAEDGQAPSNGPAGRRGDPTPVNLPSLIPYIGITADLVVADLRDLADNIHSGVRTGISSDLFIGLNFRNRAFIEARYRLMSSIKTFDLSGFDISTGYRFRF